VLGLIPLIEKQDTSGYCVAQSRFWASASQASRIAALLFFANDEFSCGYNVAITRRRTNIRQSQQDALHNDNFSEPDLHPMTTELRLIKKYPNRRLYDTATSSYITLADVKQLVLERVSFKVVDAKSNEDLTRSILLQIILDEESAGAPMFSSEMLSQIIRFYGNAMQGMMGSYLEKNIQTFIEIQRRLQDQNMPKFADGPLLNADAWSQFVKMQGPTMQGLMSSYLEQSASTFLDMQQQLQKQARSIFGNFPFNDFGAPGAESRPQADSPDADVLKQSQKKTAS
jgi:polyhydroxyalkanoate synthesis repressor PhaR